MCFYELDILFAGDLEDERNVKTDKNKTNKKTPVKEQREK